MKILIINGSPRSKGITSEFAKELKKEAEILGHEAEIVNVGLMNIGGCIACEYCHTKGDGKCLLKDDMENVYPLLSGNDIVVFASPIHYWGLSSQMQSFISRLYCQVKIECKNYALILSSVSDDVYDAPVSQYKSIVEYFGGTDKGILTFCGSEQISEENLEKIREFVKSL